VACRRGERVGEGEESGKTGGSERN